MNWIPAKYVDALAPSAGFAGSPETLHALLWTFADIGADEVHSIPTSDDAGQLREVAEVVASLP
jgi:hypothetical protein